ncbi:uncharacterized protein LOC134837005 [Culicoides brevitarsis]|uniref:uncharacterized protein LOC134837005 n=1 Tax=Culicoides brevitarsis TaxID=469753 RepID=UPI00307C9C0C
MEYLSIEQKLFENQQNQQFTDCSFRFLIMSEDGEVKEKFIHGHKMIFSAASKYFETNFKPQWSNNEPILIETVEFDVFEKLVKAIYLNRIVIESLEEGVKLYEAAHFYQMHKILILLRDVIQNFVLEKKPIAISTLCNLAWKYQDIKLIIFVSKYFCINTDIIFDNPDYLNFSPEVINWLFQYDDELSVNERRLLRALEKFVREKKATIEEIKPAICSLRFLSLDEYYIIRTNLLTEAEKDFLLGKYSVGISHLSKSKTPREPKSFFTQLPDDIQAELREKASIDHCWVCKAFHNVFECEKANEKYRVYSDIEIFMKGFESENYDPIDKVSSNMLKQILRGFGSFSADLAADDDPYGEDCSNEFSKFSNIESVLKKLYYIVDHPIHLNF